MQHRIEAACCEHAVDRPRRRARRRARSRRSCRRAASARFLSVPCLERLSRTVTFQFRAPKKRAALQPTKPAPPVISIRFVGITLAANPVVSARQRSFQTLRGCAARRETTVDAPVAFASRVQLIAPAGALTRCREQSARSATGVAAIDARCGNRAQFRAECLSAAFALHGRARPSVAERRLASSGAAIARLTRVTGAGGHEE